MGANQFQADSAGKTASEAFQSAVRYGLHMYGHRGYTGSIAEKHEFVMLDVPPNVKPQDFANWILHRNAPPEHQEAVARAQRAVDDKWGPAGCIDAGDGSYIFLGWASS